MILLAYPETGALMVMSGVNLHKSFMEQKNIKLLWWYRDRGENMVECAHTYRKKDTKPPCSMSYIYKRCMCVDSHSIVLSLAFKLHMPA